MSITLATAWVNATVSQPTARADALKLLNEAATNHLEATLIVGPGLSTYGNCFFARWDGRELVVRELTSAQQREWHIAPKALFQQLDPVALPTSTVFTEPLVSLSVVEIAGAERHDGREPLRGTCRAEFVMAHLPAIRNCALRAEYFRPDLSRQVTAMWYSEVALVPPSNILHFRFPPLFQNVPPTSRGTLVVLLQLYTAVDWARQMGCCRISNVADTAIGIVAAA